MNRFIKDKFIKKIKSEDGSITLEATIAFPVFLLFIVFIIAFIRLTYIQMTLDLAVGEATKEIATHYYPVAIAKGKVTEAIEKGREDAINKIKSTKIGSSADQLYSSMPSFVQDYVNNEISKTEEQIKSEAKDLVTSSLSPAMGSFVIAMQNNQDDGLLKSQHLHIRKMDVTGDDILVSVAYEVPVPTPMGMKTITLRSTAVERTWK